jgi:hypothetical protein
VYKRKLNSNSKANEPPAKKPLYDRQRTATSSNSSDTFRIPKVTVSAVKPSRETGHSAMVNQTVPIPPNLLAEDVDDQIKNDSVSTIAKFPEIPVRGRLSHFFAEWQKIIKGKDKVRIKT